jgi:hypothetical protein
MGKIRTVKGRERERATAAERAVVTPQRQKLLRKSMSGRPHHRVVWGHHVHSMRSRCSLRANCDHPSVALLDDEVEKGRVGATRGQLCVHAAFCSQPSGYAPSQYRAAAGSWCRQRAARPCPLLRIVLCHQIGVTTEPPFSVGLSAQNGQRVA